MMECKGKRIYLREILPSDVSEDYYRWMNDKEVVQYTESRFRSHSREELVSYVEKIRNDPQYVFCVIVVKENGKHIGNIKIGPIHPVHRFAGVGIIIGEKSYWGQGFATEAIKLITDYAFDKLNLHKLIAGCYVNNQASIKAFRKAGFIEEGLMRKQYFYNGKWVDGVSLAIINQKKVRRKGIRKFNNLQPELSKTTL